MKILLTVCLIFLTGCSKNQGKKVEHSFYYWKTAFYKDANDQKVIEAEDISHFYIHYFDVDWDERLGSPAPLAELNGATNAAPFVQAHFTPVVFITNRCFEHISEYEVEWLAGKIRDKITYISNQLLKADTSGKNKIGEIQIDCDWTKATREKYFKFLIAFKKLYPGQTISATIRLYPYKYFDKTGVPPVDKGLLMCYNLSDIKNSRTNNSIFDLKDLKQYLVSKPYPLPLDIALPVFGWYAWFGEGRFKGIIYPNQQELLTSDKKYFRQTGNIFLVTGDNVIDNNYLREGDVIRLEFPQEDALEDAAKILHARFPQAGRIALYYWDPLLIQQHEKAIHKIFTSF